MILLEFSLITIYHKINYKSQKANDIIQDKNGLLWFAT